jgi:hypothetical protein
MPVLASNIFTVTVNCTKAVLLAAPVIPETVIAGETVFATGAVVSEGGQPEYRWGTLENGLIDGASSLTLVVSDQLVGQTLYLQQRVFNSFGYPTQWWASNLSYIEAPPAADTWSVSESFILSHPPAPAAPTVNGALVSA